jgi:hypothetical protein
MFTKLLMTTAALAMLSMPAVSFAQTALEDGMTECNLPVCSLEATLAELRAMNGDERGMYAINLKSKYEDNTDVAVLENVYDLAVALRELTIELDDEDWVWRSANDLSNAMLVGMSKYSPVNGDNFVGLYKKLSNQTARYNMISYWQGKMTEMENIAQLEELIVFATGAREHSIAIDDEGWIARAASSLASEITIKLTALDPAHEGLYDVTIDQAVLDTGVFAFDRVAVLDSSSKDNLVVVFINSKFRRIVYKYVHAELLGNTIKGKFLSSSDLANTFEMTINRTTGEVTGTVKTTKTVDINFSGKQLFSTRTAFRGEVPYAITSEDVLGKMKGEIAGLKGTLTVKSFSTNVYSATFISDSGSIVMHFQGKFFAKNGVLSLTNGDKTKLTLSLRDSENGPMWGGYSFSTKTGTVTTATFAPVK